MKSQKIIPIKNDLSRIQKFSYLEYIKTQDHIMQFVKLVKVIIYLIVIAAKVSLGQVQSPVNSNLSGIMITRIGQFGLLRKPRPNIPAHYHTGIDILRPGDNYNDEPIFPIAAGKVISKRVDGPYANIIIEHEFEDKKFWTLYEHISRIAVSLNDIVNPKRPIACFMNKHELDQYGWQFDHFHLEILKVEPVMLRPDKAHPERYYQAFTLVCYTKNELNHYYYNPIEFLHSFPDILQN